RRAGSTRPGRDLQHSSVQHSAALPRGSGAVSQLALAFSHTYEPASTAPVGAAAPRVDGALSSVGFAAPRPSRIDVAPLSASGGRCAQISVTRTDECPSIACSLSSEPPRITYGRAQGRGGARGS